MAMLACARIGAPHNVVFGGFSAESVKERMEFSEAKALITVDGARRKGKTAPIKQTVDDVGMPVETTFVVRHTGIDCPMGEGDVWWDEALEAADAECPAEPLDAEHPLFILYSSGLDGQAEGHPAHDRRLPDARRVDAQARLRPQARVRRVLVQRRRRLDHRPLLHRLRPAAQRGDVGDVRGRARLPAQGHLVGAGRADRRPRSSTPRRRRSAPASSGAPSTSTKADLGKLRLLGTVGEPINPKAWLWYWKVIGGGRCPIVDTWWQTETGGIMITTLPGAQAMKPGIAGTPLPGVAAAVLDEEGNEVERGTQGLLSLSRPWPGMLRTLYGDDDRYVETYWEKWGPKTYLVGDARQAGRRGLLLGHRARRRRAQRLRPPHVDRRDRVGDRLARQGRRGRRHRRSPTRTPARASPRSSRSRATSRAPTSWSTRSASTSPSASASSRGPSASSGPTTCPRRARARSCAGC